MVVAQLASLSTESEVGNVGDRRRAVHLKAHRPVADSLVLELELERLVLEISQSHLGGDGRVTKAPGRATSQLRLLAVVVLVVARLSVAKHGHDVGEDNTGSVVLVCVDKDAQPFKLIRVPKDGTDLASLLRDPHGEAIAVELVLAVDLEFNLDFPVGSCKRHP